MSCGTIGKFPNLIQEIMDMEVTPKGFADYEISVQVTDGKSEVHVGIPNAGFSCKAWKIYRHDRA